MISRSRGGEPTTAPHVDSARHDGGAVGHPNGRHGPPAPERDGLYTILPEGGEVDRGRKPSARRERGGVIDGRQVLQRAIRHSGPWLAALVATALVLVVGSIALPTAMG